MKKGHTRHSFDYTCDQLNGIEKLRSESHPAAGHNLQSGFCGATLATETHYVLLACLQDCGRAASEEEGAVAAAALLPAAARIWAPAADWRIDG